MISKMYIAVLDAVPDYMVPTLVAHSVLNAHMHFYSGWRDEEDYLQYEDWLRNSFRKVVLRVNNKEFDKIIDKCDCWKGHENTILGGLPSCLVVLPVKVDNIPNVLKFAKMWKPKEDV